jgi:PadR family transcriptional regulator, regulatory protein PadR
MESGIRHGHDQDLLSGLIRIHVLHNACKRPVFGFALIESLRDRGYRLSPGTLYPLLHKLEKRGYLRSEDEKSGSVARRIYHATPAGREALSKVRQMAKELLGELLK